MNNQSKKIDLVCGMDLGKEEDILSSTHQSKHYYFCGEFCKKRFENDPEKFLGEPLIVLKNIHKVFKIGEAKTSALNGLDIHIWAGDFVAIIGASGSGKSTALNMVGLLDKPTSGKIILKGKDISRFSDEEKANLRSKTFGFVFQQYNLIPWLTAYENVVLPKIFADQPTDVVKMESSFKEIGLEARLHHRPFELSGGEQQRVALLRALANDPEIIIGDEPTGNLDSATGDKILGMLIDLNKSQRKTLIIVTHDADIAEKADQVIALKDGKMIKNHQKHKKIYTE